LRKIVSISLLLLLVFNWCGYRFLFNWMQQKADAKLETSLDRHQYQESDLIELSVPLNLPYQTDWAGFERVDGEITINGIHYKYVKRKIEKGQLILKCIPHHAKQQVMNARDAFFQLVNDLQQASPSKKQGTPTLAKLNISDCEEQLFWKFDTAAIAVSIQHSNNFRTPVINTGGGHTPEQPPDAS
jgi:hypothetical protein